MEIVCDPASRNAAWPNRSRSPFLCLPRGGLANSIISFFLFRSFTARHQRRPVIVRSLKRLRLPARTSRYPSRFFLSSLSRFLYFYVLSFRRIFEIQRLHLARLPGGRVAQGRIRSIHMRWNVGQRTLFYF